MKTLKKLLAALFCIALLGPVMTSCSKNERHIAHFGQVLGGYREGKAVHGEFPEIRR